MSGVVVVTSDPAVVVAQDNPAISAVVPVAAQPYAYSSLSGLPTLGTAAALNVGVAPNDVVQLDAISRLPPVDGSQLINVASGAVNYLSGLTLSTPGSSANMTVSAGAAMDSTNVDMMTLASAMTKTTSSWVAGSGGGGLDTGAIANSTWYHWYLIENPTTGVIDLCFSLSASAPGGAVTAAGFTLSRRIGSGLTNGSSQWTQFVQVGDEFLWVATVADVAAASLSTTSALFTLSVPTGVQVQALFRASMVNSVTAGASVLIQPPDQQTEAVSAVAGDASITVANTTTSGRMAMNIRTNTSAQIRAVASAASTTITIATYGWVDRRGRT